MVAERRRGPTSDAFLSVRLTQKYADRIDGVELSHAKVGDYLRLSWREASLLIREGWAVECDEPQTDQKRGVLIEPTRAEAAEKVRVTREKPTRTADVARSGSLQVSDGGSTAEDNPTLPRWLQRPAAETMI